MKNFDVYFELYGKKMKTTVFADNETDIKKIVREKIVFHKIIEKVNEKVDEKKDIKDFLGNDDTFNNLMDIFGMKK